MSRRWHWDFEDEQRAVHEQRALRPSTPAVPPPHPLAPDTGHANVQAGGRAGGSPRFWMRRAVAALALALLLAAVLVLRGGSSRHRAISQAAGAVRSAGAFSPKPSKPALTGEQAVAATLSYTPFVREGSRGVTDVALTFDDGPGPYTPALLSVLEAEHVKATFFAIGRMERYFGESTAREVRDGDVVGDHTESHPPLAELPAREQHEQIFEQMVRVELEGAPRPQLFRPPYGSFNATTMQVLHSLKLLMVLWSTDTDDYLLPGVAAIVQRALAGVHPGSIILMHDGGGDRSETIAALPQIIHALRAKGYRLVTIPQLLMDDPPPRGLPLPSSLAGD